MLLDFATPLYVKPIDNVLVAAARFVTATKRVMNGKSNLTGEPAAGAIDEVVQGNADD